MTRVKDLIAMLSEYPTDAIVLFDTKEIEFKTSELKNIEKSDDIVRIEVG